MIDVGTEEKLEKLVRLLSSDKEGEVVAAAHAIKRTLANAGSDIHELADRIRGGKRQSIDPVPHTEWPHCVKNGNHVELLLN